MSEENSLIANGPAIVRAREKLGFRTQGQFVRHIEGVEGLSRDTIRRCEKSPDEEHRPRLSSLQALAKVLGVTVENIVIDDTGTDVAEEIRDCSGIWHAVGNDLAVEGHFQYPNGPRQLEATATVTLDRKSGAVAARGLDHDQDLLSFSGRALESGNIIMGEYSIASSRLHVYGTLFLRYHLCGKMITGYYMGRGTGQGSDFILAELTMNLVDEHPSAVAIQSGIHHSQRSARHAVSRKKPLAANGQAIVRAREKLGFKQQAQFIRYIKKASIDLSADTINRCEKSPYPEHRPYLSSLETLAKVLGVAVEDIVIDDTGTDVAEEIRDCSGIWHAVGNDVAVEGHFQYPNGPRQLEATATVTLDRKSGVVTARGLDHDQDLLSFSGRALEGGNIIMGEYSIASSRLRVYGTLFLRYHLCGKMITGYYMGRGTGQGSDFILAELTMNLVDEHPDAATSQ